MVEKYCLKCWYRNIQAKQRGNKQMELHENTEKPERALLVAVDTGSYDVEASLAELYELTKTAGAEPFGAMTQKRPAYETATCVGSGMIQEIADIYQNHVLKRFDLNYSAAVKRKASEIIIFKRQDMIPTNDQLEQNGICVNIR